MLVNLHRHCLLRESANRTGVMQSLREGGSIRARQLRANASSIRTGIQIVIVTVIYVVTAKLGLMMDAVAGFATLVWPPTGIALAALIIFGYRLWPGVALGAFLANTLTGASVLVALGIASGNVLEAVAGTCALRSIPGFQRCLERLRDVLALLVLVVTFSTTVSATMGVASLTLGGIVPPSQYGETWLVWWLGDVIGALIVAPLLLVWSVSIKCAKPRTFDLKLIGETCALTLSVVGLSLFVFGEPSVFGAYLFFLPLIWAALRFGQRGVVTTTFAVSIVAVSQTVFGRGPFVQEGLSDSLFALQTFMAVTAATFLILGSALAERQYFFLHEQQARTTAEAAVRSRDAFISVASHELRSPLSGLHLAMELFQRNPTIGDKEHTTQTAAKVSRQLQRMTRLVHNLLDVSRIRAGKLHLDYEQVDLGSIVRDVVARYEQDIQRSGSDVTITADSPIVGVWDPMRIEQIVTNLLSNALKYGSGMPIEIRVEGDDRTGRLIVRDNGIGIAAEDQSRIFEQFERIATSKTGGLGLGLWIVRQIASAVGGSIRVVSELGRGSTFNVELPRSPGYAP